MEDRIWDMGVGGRIRIKMKMKKFRIWDCGFGIWPPRTFPRPSTLPAPRWNDCPLTRGDCGIRNLENRKAEGGNCEEALALAAPKARGLGLR